MFNLQTFQYNNNPETPVAVVTDSANNPVVGDTTGVTSRPIIDCPPQAIRG
jgi:hypothetical protein